MLNIIFVFLMGLFGMSAEPQTTSGNSGSAVVTPMGGGGGCPSGVCDNND